MSEQTVSKSVPTIPQRIIEEIERFFSESSTMEFEHPVFQKVENVEFIRTYQNRYGICEEFKVNGVILVFVYGENYWTYKTVAKDQEDKKAFGKRVKYVIEEAKVPWDLAKIAVKKYPVNPFNSESLSNAQALFFIETLKENLVDYQNFWKEKISVEDYLRVYFWEHLSNKQLCIIKEYWLSQNA